MERQIWKFIVLLIIGLNPYYNGRYSWRHVSLNITFETLVLILIIMEDTHGAAVDTRLSEETRVLILIIMEDTHGVPQRRPVCCGVHVLILIIMEDTHGELSSCRNYSNYCLNPYYNGRYSWRIVFSVYQ